MFDTREPGSVSGSTIHPAPFPANARTPQERRQQRDQADDPEPFRPRRWVVEPADWIRYLDEHTAA